MKYHPGLDRFIEKHFGDSWTVGRLTIFGRNAMHFAINYRRRAGGWICVKPPTYCFGKWWGPYIYLSPDATPNRATFIIPKNYVD